MGAPVVEEMFTWIPGDLNNMAFEIYTQ